ncbi:MAG: DUF1376 domain-containing protein [Candidatus Aminicenantes bacterium]|nr:MAG: DUF1376 domain-containing protein [Candidatus Aminicenantes bacterium]
MSNPPAFQLYAADFYMDTISWTSEEVGCYFRLLMTEWVNGPLEFNAKYLQNICKISSHKWPKLWQIIAEKFVMNGDGHLINIRLEKIRTKHLKYIEKQKEPGSRGAEKKKKLGLYPFNKNKGSLDKPLNNYPRVEQALLSSSSLSTKIPKKEHLDKVCDEISKKLPKALFNPYQFVNANKKVHPGAILHTLNRILREGQTLKEPWGYAVKILSIEHQNYNERDAMEQAEKYKKELADFAREMERKSKT